jgi:hypothetical protein
MDLEEVNSLPKKLFLVFAFILLAALVFAGCGGNGDQPPAQQDPGSDGQPASPSTGQVGSGADFIFVSSADTESCASCHPSLEEDMAKLENHPPVEIENGIVDCVPCHPDEGDISLEKVIHDPHYEGGDANDFVANFEGACVHCHKLTTEGQMPAAGLEEGGTQFQEIRVASVNLSPTGSKDCHASIAAEVEKLEGHPEATSEDVADCIACHQEGSPLAMSAIMHQGHLLKKEYENFGNSCINCHDLEKNMAVKGL